MGCCGSVAPDLLVSLGEVSIHEQIWVKMPQDPWLLMPRLILSLLCVNHSQSLWPGPLMGSDNISPEQVKGFFAEQCDLPSGL